jgi:flagellar basal-body rod protein FlgB
MEIKALDQHTQALRFRALRNQVLSSNIANADTPNYKARDFSFRDALSSARTGAPTLQQTSELHLQRWGTSKTEHPLMYRLPMQSTLDGNTVETDVEQAAFAENALMYRASLAFLDGQIRSLKYALRGGD